MDESNARQKISSKLFLNPLSPISNYTKPPFPVMKPLVKVVRKTQPGKGPRFSILIYLKNHLPKQARLSYRPVLHDFVPLPVRFDGYVLLLHWCFRNGS